MFYCKVKIKKRAGGRELVGIFGENIFRKIYIKFIYYFYNINININILNIIN